MKNIHKQAGITLIETMIGLALSLIVTTSMIGLMGNSMGSASRIIKMSQLTDEMRNAMSMMSRDVRRANYNANNIYCYANSDCGIDNSATQSSDVIVTTTDGDSCFIFGLDRDYDGNANNDGGGGFRRVTTGGVGVIEMWVGSSVPACGSGSADWVAVTDPEFVNITGFRVDDSASFNNVLEAASGTVTQRTRFVEVEINGQLVLDNTITRTIQDKVKLRNNFFL
jgi:type II secretory pathway pseudopilin PulG